MNKFFENLKAEKEIKNRYKELAKKYHPDLGGCNETMKLINTQYEQVLRGVYQDSGCTQNEIDDLIAHDQVIRSVLFEIIGLPDLVIELCGSWIWVTGNTKAVRDKLKIAGFFWAPNKQAWYWRREERKMKRGRSEPWMMDRIRQQYDSKIIETLNRGPLLAR